MSYFSFLVDNWQNIIITVAVSAFFYFLSNYAIRKYVSSAEKERIEIAKKSLLDILESRIINKQTVPSHKIKHLIRAIERENSVALSRVVTPISILEDLELIFENSHHLDPDQKNNYCDQIQNEIESIIKSKRDAFLNSSLPGDYLEISDKLSKEIKNSDSENALKSLELLKKQFALKSNNESSIVKDEFDDFLIPLLSIIATIFLLALFYYVISRFIPILIDVLLISVNDLNSSSISLILISSISLLGFLSIFIRYIKYRH